MAPEVSLILPTQGRRHSLAVALRSALQQDFSPLEIIVVDDSVEDRTWRSRAGLAPLLADARVRLVPAHRGLGCAAAKNAGWAAARGRWLCYLDDDNEYRPDKVAAQYALALASGAPVVLCGLEVAVGPRRRSKQVTESVVAGEQLALAALPDTNVLFHRADVRVRWDEELGTADDACLFQAILAETGLRTVPNVPRPLVTYHAHQGERANRAWERHYRGQRRLLLRSCRGYARATRRILLLRLLVSSARFRTGGWLRLLRHGAGLLRAGGRREWRLVANTLGARTLLVRRWMVS